MAGRRVFSSRPPLSPAARFWRDRPWAAFPSRGQRPAVEKVGGFWRPQPIQPPAVAGSGGAIMFDGFQAARVHIGDASIFVRRAGNGPALLMLHGFPQTHLMWRDVAPGLADRF